MGWLESQVTKWEAPRAPGIKDGGVSVCRRDGGEMGMCVVWAERRGGKGAGED